MLSSNQILDFLKTNKTIFEEKFHCQKIGLFGSFARNEQTEKSDIDIMVVFQPDTPDFYTTEIEIKDFIGKQFNRKVDVCAEKWIKPVFKPLISKEVVYA